MATVYDAQPTRRFGLEPWNGVDPALTDRMFGLTTAEGVINEARLRTCDPQTRRDERTDMTISPSPQMLAATRDAWHRVAEHVLAAAQYADTAEITLRPVAGGFQTTHPLRGNRRLSVVNTQLIITDDTGTRATPLTTVAAAADFAGITPGMPESVYPPATPLEPNAPLHVDADSARLLAGWYELADAALRRFASDIGAPPQPPILWPEHFDVGITVGPVNYGASPGDQLALPYLYVGPHAGPPTRDGFWNATFGAARTLDDVTSVDDAVAFYHTGRQRLSEAPMPS